MDLSSFSFEKLTVWQEARSLVKDIYLITSKFPWEEQDIVKQIRRSAISVAANIAEGVTRSSPKEQAHYTSIAYGSLMELFNHLILGGDLDCVRKTDIEIQRKSIRNIAVRLSNLRASQLSKLKTDRKR